jgi:hypothetical protein
MAGAKPPDAMQFQVFKNQILQIMKTILSLLTLAALSTSAFAGEARGTCCQPASPCCAQCCDDCGTGLCSGCCCDDGCKDCCNSDD